MSRPRSRNLVATLPPPLALDLAAAHHVTVALQRLFDGPGGTLPLGR
jgi:hypothetical protein